MDDRGSVETLVAVVDVIICVCPPGAAVAVANQVSGLGFDGLYVDVNAVSPSTSRRIGRLFDRFVDGGIVGPPPTRRKAAIANPGNRIDDSGTRLYLSGREASEVAALFAGSPVDARVIGSEPGRASALKMAYAAWTKGTSALLLSVAAVAAAEDVAEELLVEWDMSLPDLRSELEHVAASIGKKAWRFVAEMEEIAATYGHAGLPEGFHTAAADVYLRLVSLQHDPRSRLDEIVNILLHQPGDR